MEIEFNSQDPAPFRLSAWFAGPRFRSVATPVATSILCSVGSPRPTLVSVRREAPPGSELALREATSMTNCRPHGSGDATNLELGPRPRSVVTPVTTNQHGALSAASLSLRSYSPGLAPRARLHRSVATPVTGSQFCCLWQNCVPVTLAGRSVGSPRRTNACCACRSVAVRNYTHCSQSGCTPQHVGGSVATPVTGSQFCCLWQNCVPVTLAGRSVGVPSPTLV